MESSLKFSVEWAMPNKATFSIPPIRRFIDKWIPQDGNGIIIDPFCGDSTIGNVTNDIKESGIDSLDWLKQLPSQFADFILHDPPYTPRQLKECYDSLGLSLHDTTAGYWGKLRDELTRISKPGTVVLSFGYGASHIGTTRGFQTKDGLVILPVYQDGAKIVDGLLVQHGGMHNATICIAEIYEAKL